MMWKKEGKRMKMLIALKEKLIGKQENEIIAALKEKLIEKEEVKK